MVFCELTTLMSYNDNRHTIGIVTWLFLVTLNFIVMTTSKAVLGILAGIAAGAVIGVLLAPDKGDRLKKNITRKSQDLADAINEKIDEKFNELLTSIPGKVKNVRHDSAEPQKES